MNLRKLIKKQEPKKKRRSKRGSYLVEAALTLPVFILCIVALALVKHQLRDLSGNQKDSFKRLS